MNIFNLFRDPLYYSLNWKSLTEVRPPLLFKLHLLIYLDFPLFLMKAICKTIIFINLNHIFRILCQANLPLKYIHASIISLLKSELKKLHHNENSNNLLYKILFYHDKNIKVIFFKLIILAKYHNSEPLKNLMCKYNFIYQINLLSSLYKHLLFPLCKIKYLLLNIVLKVKYSFTLKFSFRLFLYIY